MAVEPINAFIHDRPESVGWETVNVFVSSTFNDMHAERDYLVKEVFPSLREWCERRKLRLVDVDLRWGVTEADATRHKRVVDVCLRKIDDCRPFFICLIGQRYGWIPKRGDVSEQTLHDFLGLSKALEISSVTELEILHSCVEPMSDRQCSEHAFFYLREPGYVQHLPQEPLQLRRNYSDEAETDPASRLFLKDKLETLRKQKIPATGRPVHHYQAHWDPAQKTPEIAMPLACPAGMSENQERWRRDWREQAGVHAKGLDVAEDPQEKAKAEAHNERLTCGRLSDFRCEQKTLGEVICEDLKAAIAARYPGHVEATGQTDLDREIELQEEFIHATTEGFIERQGDFDALDAWVEDASDRRVFALTAVGGIGKSTLLAKWVQKRRAKGETVLGRFIGVGDRSASVDMLLNFLIQELQSTGCLTTEVPEDPRKLREKLTELLAGCGKKGRTVIVIDALDQLESGLTDLDWLPLELPTEVKLVVSLKRGEPGADQLEASWSSGNRAQLHEPRGFESIDDRKKLVRAYLEQYLKELDEEHLDALVRAPGAENPLFLRVVLSELRVFGSFGSLGEKIRNDFGETPVSAFDAVLKRLERDPSPAGLDPRKAVPILFGLLAHSRGGLPKQAMLDLLREELSLSTDQQPAVQATVESYLRQVRPFLARREGRTDFFFAGFRAASQARYVRQVEGADAAMPLRPATAWHHCLARWSDRWPELGDTAKPYALRALVHHYLEAKETDPAAAAMTDFGYLHARLEHLGANDVSEVSRDFAALARATLQSGRHKDVVTWKRFFDSTTHYLRRPGILPEVEFMQKSYAYAETHPVTLEAEAWLERNGSNHWWFRRLGRHEKEMRSACLRVLDGGTDSISSLAFHVEGQRAASGNEQGLVLVWDLGTGECLKRMGHYNHVSSLAFHADRRRLVTGSYDRTARVWDWETGECLKVFEHNACVECMALHVDGRSFVTGLYDGAMCVWNLETGASIKTLDGRNRVCSLALHPDGQRIISGHDDGTVQIWDMESGRCLATLKGHTEYVKMVALDADGLRLVSGSNMEARLWDLNTGTCMKVLDSADIHSGANFSVSSTALGWRMVTGGREHDGCIRLLDLDKFNVETGEGSRSIHGPKCQITSVVLDVEGGRALTGSKDGTIRLWDLEATRDEVEESVGYQILSVEALALSADGRRAVSAASVEAPMVWDLDTGSCLRHLDGAFGNDIFSVMTLADEWRMASCCSVLGTMTIWNLETGACLKALDVPKSVRTVALHADGQRVISGHHDGTVYVWDLNTSECLHTLKGHTGSIATVVLHVDGRRAVSGSWDGTARVWNLETGECLLILKGQVSRKLNDTDHVHIVVSHADGRRAVTAGSEGMKGLMWVWDLKTGECPRILKGHEYAVTSITIHADGRRAVSGSMDYTLRVWDLESGECLRVLKGHTKSVTSVALHADGRRAVSASDDGTIRAWDLEMGKCLAVWLEVNPIKAMDMSKLGNMGHAQIAAGCDDGSVHFLELMPPSIIELRQEKARIQDVRNKRACLLQEERRRAEELAEANSLLNDDKFFEDIQQITDEMFPPDPPVPPHHDEGREEQ